jgi:branched-chain amino acid transport system permease protein
MNLGRFIRIDRRFGGLGFVLAVASLACLAVVASLSALGINAAFSGLLTDVCIMALIYACITVGLQVFVGGTGIVSFGHIGFVALGAYAAGIVSVPPEAKNSLLPKMPAFLAGIQIDFPASLLIAAIIPAVIAFALGPVLMRLTGQAAAVTSFAFLVIVNDVLRNAKSLTNGVQTFSRVPLATTITSASIALVIVVAVAAVYKWSPAGLRSRATRENELAAAAAGVSVLASRLWPWTLSAGICGLAGGLWAHFLTAFAPTTFFLQPTTIVIVMLFAGGAMSLTGALIGAAGVSIWLEFARRIDAGASFGSVQLPALAQFSDLSLAVFLIILLQVWPNGFIGYREVQIPTADKLPDGKDT